MQGEDVVGLLVAAGRRMVGSGDVGCGTALAALNGDTEAGGAVIAGQPGHADGIGRADAAAQRQAWAARIVGICRELVQIREGTGEGPLNGMGYEASIEARFGMNRSTLRTYLKSYENLGRQGELYERLLQDMGVERTYALSIIREMAPEAFAAFHAMPRARQQATRKAELQGIIAQLKVERALMEEDRADLTSDVRRLQMELAAERGGTQ